MQRLLSFEDAFIRAQAVRIWFEEDRSNDTKLLDRIFADTHPSIADAALLGTIDWHILESLLCGSLPAIVVASIASARMSDTVVRVTLGVVLLIVVLRFWFL